MEYIALFDLDGVILDTEGQYTLVWNRIGEKYGKEKDFGILIKGHTVDKILKEHFHPKAQSKEVIQLLNEFETEMRYDYVPGAVEFVDSLKGIGVRCAVVTSSNRLKMEKVYRIFKA